MAEIEPVLLGEILTFQRGHDITKKDQSPGPYPVISSGGAASTHSEYKYDGPGVIIGRKGTLGGVHWSADRYWPHDTTLWVKDFKQNNPRYVYYLLKTLGLERFDVGASNPTLNRNHLHLLKVVVIEPDAQENVARTLSTFDDLIENNRRRIEILKEMARLLYREWFVHFRFPGYEDVEMVDSELGPIPEGWAVRTIEEVQADQRNATSAGPFGSKLGRKDYVDEGVPVIRGTNLAVGGGFHDRGFVFVSEEKAETLRSSTARSGDVLVTQRGTLGQVGLIGKGCHYPEYVISQSQMKLTCHEEVVRPLVIYMQLSLPEGVQRVLNMATGSGVPHINLGMFREMDMIIPPLDLQDSYLGLAEPLQSLVENLTSQKRVLREARDLLLPRLVSGELDVSDLDLEGAMA